METAKRNAPCGADASDHDHRSSHLLSDGDGVVGGDHGHRIHRSNCCAADGSPLGW